MICKNIQDYLQQQFPTDFGKLSFKRPNDIECEISKEKDVVTLFWGGREWENFDRDISRVAPANVEYFVLCAFTVTLIDLNMFTYYNERYEIFRRKTMYPKFGWSGFGSHHENPKIILFANLHQ